jgi:hypothetical protein
MVHNRPVDIQSGSSNDSGYRNLFWGTVDSKIRLKTNNHKFFNSFFHLLLEKFRHCFSKKGAQSLCPTHIRFAVHRVS